MKRDHNPMSASSSDMEVAEQFGLDPNLAGTPAINEAMLDVVFQKNVQAGVEEGKTLEAARSFAGAQRAKARREIAVKDKMLNK